MKPKPLDLKGMEKAIELRINQLLEEVKFNEEQKLILKRVLTSFQRIKQRIKSACEFYLKYRNNPELLVRDYPEYGSEVVDICGFNLYGQLANSQKYNEWLFKLAFKDVLEEEEKDETRT